MLDTGNTIDTTVKKQQGSDAHGNMHAPRSILQPEVTQAQKDRHGQRSTQAGHKVLGSVTQKGLRGQTQYGFTPMMYLGEEKTQQTDRKWLSQAARSLDQPHLPPL